MPNIDAFAIGSAESIGTHALLNGQAPTVLAEALVTADVLPEAATSLSEAVMTGLDTQSAAAPSGRRQTVKGSNLKWEEP